LSKLIRSRLKELIAFISLSYIPKIRARVPPEIPGITSATPMAIPLQNRENLASLFMRLLL
jgi:hypothetical protein